MLVATRNMDRTKRRLVLNVVTRIRHHKVTYPAATKHSLAIYKDPHDFTVTPDTHFNIFRREVHELVSLNEVSLEKSHSPSSLAYL